jgi:hypothetical protein
MPKQRDGPAPFAATPGPGVDERARLLPRLKTSRKYRARSFPPPHRRPRRRQRDTRWRVFSVRLCAPPGSDGAHALYALLKLAAERYGLEVGNSGIQID